MITWGLSIPFFSGPVIRWWYWSGWQDFWRSPIHGLQVITTCMAKSPTASSTGKFGVSVHSLLCSISSIGVVLKAFMWVNAIYIYFYMYLMFLQVMWYDRVSFKKTVCFLWQEDELKGDRHWIDMSPPLQKLVKFEEETGLEFTHIRLLARAFTMRNVGFNHLTLYVEHVSRFWSSLCFPSEIDCLQLSCRAVFPL